ncbi:hypothetical protein BDZ85DRAFT_263621 [Elsinoe ampelina]|uniref:Uncharacterized protein n=1 Tax=Elsinoe ampelina TaxID=302913 RepID=A0A6A6G9H4_9PEZI|nr:hypothetical protein BDZ85DRAFT_263621 [Elsinoe ampelina]
MPSTMSLPPLLALLSRVFSRPFSRVSSRLFSQVFPRPFSRPFPRPFSRPFARPLPQTNLVSLGAVDLPFTAISTLSMISVKSLKTDKSSSSGNSIAVPRATLPSTRNSLVRVLCTLWNQGRNFTIVVLML